MKSASLKPVAILLFVAILIGLTVHYFTGFSWLTAGLIFLIAVMVNGFAMFSEDVQVGGIDYQQGITDTDGALKEQNQAKRIQGIIICLLVVLMICSYVFEWGV